MAQATGKTEVVVPRPAATTLIARDGRSGVEVLMVRRSLQASFMPGSYVFPGGAVDASDDALQTLDVCDESAERLAQRIGAVTGVGAQAASYAVAALRECFEECGLWLGAPDHRTPASGSWESLRARARAGEPLHVLAAAAGVALATSALQPWSHWVTPVGMPKRFDTLFFVAKASQGQQPAADLAETTALSWVHPATALAACDRGEFPMEFATRTTVQSLLPWVGGRVDDLLAHAASLRALPAVHPRLRRGADGKITAVVLPDQPGYAALGASDDPV